MKTTAVKASKLGTNWTAEHHLNHAMSRTQWIERIGKADATHCSAEIAAADTILTNLQGYRRNSTRRWQDTQELAAALEAYAILLQRHGVTVHDPEKPDEPA